MVFGFFRKDKVEEPAKPGPRRGPLGLQVERVIDVDLLRYAMISDKLGKPVGDTARIVVAAHGLVDLGDGRFLHRFYDDDHRFLQIMSEGADEESAVVDVSYFRPWDSLAPADDADWATWTGQGGKLGARTYDADGILFDRAWNPEVDRWIPSVQFTEDVRDAAGNRRDVFQKMMFYDRLIGDLGETLIISVDREISPRQGEATVEFSLGLPLTTANVRSI